MKRILFCVLICFWAWVGKAQQIAIEGAFGGAINSGLYETKGFTSRLGLGTTFGFSARFVNQKGVYLKPALYYAFTNALTRTNIQYTNVNGSTGGNLNYNLFQHTLNFAAYVGYRENKWSFDVAPVLMYNISTYANFNKAMFNTELDTKKLIFGMSAGVYMDTWERTRIGFCFSRGITNMFNSSIALNKTVTMLLFKYSHLLKK